jgi:hypothetical protein
MKPGDLIEQLAKPVARALDLPCLDPQGNLRPESGCAQRRDAINRFADSVYDIFWPSNNNKEKEQ